MDSRLQRQLCASDAILSIYEHLNGPQPRFRRERNALSPLSLLPPEIVSSIMKYTMDDVLKDCPSTTYYDWTAVTQVYSYWREVALSCPALWTHIEGQNVAWTRAFLERSGDLFLEINMRQSEIEQKRNGGRPAAWYRSFVDLLLANMHRTQHLFITLATHKNCIPDSPHGSPAALFAPNLERLIVYNAMDDDPDTTMHYQCWFIRLIPTHTPALHHLDIRNLRASSWIWIRYARFLPTVTHLTLSEFKGDVIWQFQQIARCATNLEQLTLEGNHIEDEEPELEDMAIELPHLRFLNARRTSFQLLEMLDLSVSPICYIELEYPFYQWTDRENDWFASLADVLEPLYSGEQRQIRSLFLYIQPGIGSMSVNLVGVKSDETVGLRMVLTSEGEELGVDGFPETFGWFLEGLERFQYQTGLVVELIHLAPVEDTDFGIQVLREFREFSSVRTLQVAADMKTRDAYKHFRQLGDPDCSGAGGDGHEPSRCESCIRFSSTSFTGLKEVQYWTYDHDEIRRIETVRP